MKKKATPKKTKRISKAKTADPQIESLLKAYGKRLAEERKQAGLTQAELGSLCGVGINFVSQIENGKTSAHIGLFFKVAQTLGLKLQITH